jgi:integrase
MSAGSRCPLPDEAEAIVAAALEQDRMFGGFCLCGRWSGLRLHEVAELRPGDVVLGEPGRPARLHVRHGKRIAGVAGPRPRTALLYEPGLQVVLEAVELARVQRRGEVFSTSARTMFSRQRVAKRFSAACRVAGVEGVTFHGLRKRFGSDLLDWGVPELDVAVALGHFRRDGRPHVEFVRQVYGWPSTEAALRRLEGTVAA